MRRSHVNGRRLRAAAEEDLVRFRHFIGASVLAVLSMSCSLGDPTDAGSINLFVDVNKSTLPIGESMIITVTARNVGFDPLTLTGPSDCLLYVEVLTVQGEVVWNPTASCAGSTVTEEVLPGNNKVQAFSWEGTNLAGARLSAGYYYIRPIARVTGAAYMGPRVSVALE